MIAGTRVVASRQRSYDVFEPATGEHFASVAEATNDDLETAIRHARIAQRSWRDYAPEARAEVLYAVADLLEHHGRALAELDTRSSGKPLRETLGEAQFSAAVFRYYAGLCDQLMGDTIPRGSQGMLMTQWEPIGIVAAITPYNAPLATMALKTAPALAAGNAVIGKPAQHTPFSALRLAELLAEAGLPDGLFSVLTSGSAALPMALVDHAEVRRITFTGSTRVGKEIARRSSAALKRLTLELGGKSACLVFADADIELAAAMAPEAVFTNAGQDCCARSRLIVHESIREEFVAAYVEAAGKLAVGDPLNERTVIGPLISRDHRDTVHSFVQQGVRSGARVRCGGEPVSPAGFEAGAFYAPTVLDHLPEASPLMQQELFGPVVGVQTFRTEEEAIALANDSSFGLSGSLWTRDLGRALRVSRNIDTGVLGVNSNRSVFLSAPFGGRKDSGLGHEYGLGSLQENSELKSVYFAM